MGFSWFVATFCPVILLDSKFCGLKFLLDLAEKLSVRFVVSLEMVIKDQRIDIIAILVPSGESQPFSYSEYSSFRCPHP